MPPKNFLPQARGAFSRLLLHPRLLFHPHETSSSRGVQREWCDTSSFNVGSPDQSQLLPPEVDLSLMTDPSTPPEHLVDAVWNLRPFLPIGYGMLGQGDLKIIGSYPVDASGFADVWIGELNDGTAVAIKSLRYYSSSSRLPVYLRLYKETLMCSRLNDNDESFVSLMGVYSTLEHPFALVFKFMDHLNLRGYLRNNRDIGRLEVLLEIARGLWRMHGLGIVHGNLEIVNILVGGDGHVRIAGLGTAFVLPTVPATDVDQSFHSTAPELIDPQRRGYTDSGVTTASDVYAFAVMAWEVFAGRSPFSAEGVVAGVHSMSNGRRPDRPDHPELSNRVWRIIKRCWKGDPTQRATMVEVVTILEAETKAHKRK